jgi:hypothetical protein
MGACGLQRRLVSQIIACMWAISMLTGTVYRASLERANRRV